MVSSKRSTLVSLIVVATLYIQPLSSLSCYTVLPPQNQIVIMHETLWADQEPVTAMVTSVHSSSSSSSLISSSSSVLQSFISDEVDINKKDHESKKIISDNSWAESGLSKLKTEKDTVVRVLDANTVKLKKTGLLSFAGVYSPSGYNEKDKFPACMTKSPSYEVRKLLPPGSKVGVQIVEKNNKNNNNSSRPRAALIVVTSPTKKMTKTSSSSSSSTTTKLVLVNAELVKAGFARPRRNNLEETLKQLPGLAQDLQRMQIKAKEEGLGMYVRCDKLLEETAVLQQSDHKDYYSLLDDQFEQLDFTVETQFGDDGGKQVIVQRKSDKQKKEGQPGNPGDVRGCSDFASFEDSLRYYEKFYPFYGDVAKLDRDGDGVPCPGLPHTTDQGRYRMKVPSAQKGMP